MKNLKNIGKKLSAVLLVAAMAVSMTACGGNDTKETEATTTEAATTEAATEETTTEAADTEENTTEEAAAEEASEAANDTAKTGVLKVALILPGKKDDVSFNQAMYEGLMAYCEEHADEIELKVTENVYEVADIEPALMDFADMGYDVVFGHGFQFMEPIVKVAPNYPDTYFLLGTGYKSVDNSAIYDVHLQSGGYLMGVVAALATETNQIGVIGGANAAEIYRGHEAFKLGAQSVNPDIQIQEVYTGDWTDTVGAKEAAVAMYDAGVDVIWHSGDGIGLGVVQAAKEKDAICLGNVADQNSLAADNVMTGVVYKWDAIIEQIFDDIRSGNFEGREDADRYYWITAENEGLVYAPIVDKKGVLTEEELTQIETTYQQLVNGEIEMPDFGDPE